MKRVLTALVGIPLVILATIFSPDWFFVLLIGIFAALCFEEFLTLGAARLGVRPGRWVVVLGAVVTTSFIGGEPWVLTTATLSLLVSVTAITLSDALETTL